MKDFKALLDLVFEPSDEIAVSDSKFACHSMPIASVLSGEVTLVSSNPSVANKIVKSSELTLLAINAVKGFRKDDNVTSCRAFLFECDVGTLDSQMRYAADLGLPYSAAIYSGNKSIHFLTVLDQPVDAKLYRDLAQWALNIGTLFDQNCKNPSRCVRIPGNIRPDTGKMQQLIKLNGRVKLEYFLTWLEKYPDSKPKKHEKKELTNPEDHGRLSPWLRKALKENKLDFSKGRNRMWYAIFCNFAAAGYSQDEAEYILERYYEEESDFNQREWLTCSKSAYLHIDRDNNDS